MAEGIYARNVRRCMNYLFKGIENEVPCYDPEEPYKRFYCDLYDRKKDIAYEIKSSKQDLYTGYGMNWIGNLNYLLCPPELVFEANARLEELGYGYVGIIAYSVSKKFDHEVDGCATYLLTFSNQMTLKEAKPIKKEK